MIKSPIKTNKDKTNQIIPIILENFPENYQNMKYIEPFIGNGSILLNKEKSIEEVACDNDSNIINIWRSIRDENKNFKSKLLKLNYNEKIFDLFKSKKVEKEYFKDALSEFVLLKMSKLSNKSTFNKLDRKKSYKFWKETAENIKNIEERIKSVYFLYNRPFELLEKFDSSSTFCFCSAPFYEDDKKSELTTDEHIQLCDLLLNFRGKVILYSNNCSFYRRLFKDWKNIKLKTKKDCLWINF